MKKINLCIDIDSTVTKPDYWVDYFNKHFNTNYKYSDDTVEEYLKNNNVDYKIFDEFYHKYAEEMHKTAEIRPDAFENIKKLEEFCTISYVTARELRTKEVTLDWFKKHDLPMSDLHMLGSHYKVAKAKELDCHVFIEDRYENALELTLGGFKVLLLDCPYNRNYTIPGMIRVFNWNHILDEIDEHLNKVNKESISIA